MPSPNFTINGSATPPEKAVAYNATVTLALLSTSGVNTIAWSIVGTDSTGTPSPAITPGGSPLGATATFTMVADPATGLGASLRVQCKVNGGLDSAGQVDPSLTKTALVGVHNVAGIVPLAVGEQFERDAVQGWTGPINTALANVGNSGAPIRYAFPNLTNNFSATNIGVLPVGFYSVLIELYLHTTGTSGGITANLAWTDRAGFGHAVSTVQDRGSIALVVSNAYSLPISVDGVHNVTHQVTGISTPGALQYDLHYTFNPQ